MEPSSPQKQASRPRGLLSRMIRALLLALGGFIAGVLVFYVLAAAFLGRAHEVKGLTSKSPFVETVLPAPLEDVLAATRLAFNSQGTRHTWNKYPEAIWLHDFDLYPMDDPIFPRDGEIRANAQRGSDPALIRYISLPAERRRNDLMLYRSDGYWASEYRSSLAAPALFSTHFFIHIEAVSAQSTRVEVIEYDPMVIAGEVWGYGRHSILPSFIQDVQRVAPTTRERVFLLQRIHDVLPQQWTLSFDGLGPVRIGLTVHEAEEALNAKLREDFGVDNPAECHFALSDTALPGVGLMLIGGKIVRIDVHNRAYRTTRGVGIGTAEQEVKRLHPQIKVEPHQYDPFGHYLVLMSEHQQHGIVFETDGRWVTGLRGGEREPLGYERYAERVQKEGESCRFRLEQRPRRRRQ